MYIVSFWNSSKYWSFRKLLSKLEQTCRFHFFLRCSNYLGRISTFCSAADKVFFDETVLPLFAAMFLSFYETTVGYCRYGAILLLLIFPEPNRTELNHIQLPLPIYFPFFFSSILILESFFII